MKPSNNALEAKKGIYLRPYPSQLRTRQVSASPHATQPSEPDPPEPHLSSLFLAP